MKVFFPSKLPNNIVQRSHGRKHHSVLETDKDAFLYTVNNTSRRDAVWLQSPVLVVFSYSYFVYFFHDSFCLLEHIDDAAVVLYIFETKSHALAVFEPFLGRLVASDEEVPGGFRHAVEVLLCVDIDAIILPTVAIHLQRACNGEGDTSL